MAHWRDALREGAFNSRNPRCAEFPPAALLDGIGLFNVGEYFECHEVLEHIWMEEEDSIRYLYQGILQIGVALHHLRNGNYRGATLLLTDGIQKVNWFCPECLAVNTGLLSEQAQQCLDALTALGPERAGEFDWTLAPQIEYRT